MSKFGVTTWLAIAAASVVFIIWPRPRCTYAVGMVWLVYLPIFACGVILIQMNYFTRAICRGTPGRNVVALTFDDGPNPAATPELLDLLKREGISATFFCIGKDVAQHPEITARIAAEGHLVANHSFTHPWYISMLWGEKLNRELAQTQDAIESATGVRPTYFRPPSGTTGPHFPAALKQLGLTLGGWDVRSLDTVTPPRKAIERILRLATDGSIIVLHDGGGASGHVVEIVSAAVKELRARGFSFERLDRLVGHTELLENAPPAN